MGWINAALFVLRNRRARSAVLGISLGAIAALFMVVVILVSSIAGMYSMCQERASAISGAPSMSSPTYSSSEPSEAALADIPGNYLEAYQAAGEEYGMDWAFLAAVGKQETNHGQDIQGCATSEDGARGPMQFIPSTWASEGVDGNGDGTKDPCNVEDAVHTAGSYLQSLGAPQDYHGALCSYYGACGDANANYADEVMAQMEEYKKAAGESGGGSGNGDSGSTPAIIPPLISEAHAQEGGSGGSASDGSSPEVVFPIEGENPNYSDDWGQSRPGFAGGSHEGTDIFAEKGTPVRAIVAGEVVENATNNENSYSEVGGYNVMIEATEDAGPIKKGDAIIYAHMQEPPSVEVGDSVEAGEQIGQVGATGYGPEVTRDEFDPHLHIGWYDDSGAERGSERAESPTGAMNPYSMLGWVEENSGGGSSGDGSGDAGGDSSSGDSSSSPVQSPTTGADSALPAHCTPFQTVGLIQDVGQGVSNLAGGPGTGSGSGSSGTTPKGSGTGREVYEEALKYDGVAYELYSCQPGTAMDCSCLTMEVFKKFGVNLPWPVMDQQNYGEPVEGEPKIGDLIVYGPGPNGYPGHVAISDGNGGVFHCASPALGCVTGDDYRNAAMTEVVAIRRLV